MKRINRSSDNLVRNVLFRPWGVLLLWVAFNVGAAPRLQCENPNFDFGTMINPDKISHEFMLKNIGDEPVRISTIKNCCGVSSSIDPMIILPGSNAVCRSVFNCKNRYGPQEKQILIASNDQRNPYFELRMTGTLQQAIEVSPRYLRLGDLSTHSELSQIIKAVNLLEEVVILESVESTVPGIHVEMVGGAEGATSDERGPQRSWEVRLTSNGNLRAGRLSGQIRLNFSTGSVSVPVMGHVQAALQVVPESITLSKSTDQSVERRVMLRNIEGSSFSIESAELINLDGTVEYQKLAPGKWSVMLQLMPSSVKPFAELNVKLSDGPDIRIPIR